MSGYDLQAFKTLIRQRSGLMLEGLAETQLKSSLTKRMSAAKLDSSAAYLSRLGDDEAEFHELISLLTVNETYFYREPEQLRLLTRRLVPRRLAERTGGPKLRILSAGCSTGEEPYSIAMAMREEFGEGTAHLFTLIAGDIDHRAMTAARQAEYGVYSFRAIPAELRQRYFSSTGGSNHLIDADLHAMVEFHALNLLAPHLPKVFSDFDVIFFRNVSIYFDEPTRRGILATLRDMMADGGCLIVGMTETLANDLGVFRLVEEDGLFYFVKGASPVTRQAPALPPPSAPRPVAPVRAVPKPIPRPVSCPSPPAATPPPTMEAVRALVRDGRFKDAKTAIATLCAVVPRDLGTQILEGYIQMQLRDFAAASAMAKDVLARDDWSADAHMLLALVAKAQGDTEEAIRQLQTIIYSRPDCWPAHYFLGALLQGRDDDKARRAYRAALRQITRAPDPDGGLGLPLDLPIADIRFLCERRVGGPPAPAQEQGGRGRGA